MGVSLALFFPSALPITKTECLLILSSNCDTLLLRSLEWHLPGRKLRWERQAALGACSGGGERWSLDILVSIKERMASKVGLTILWGSFAKKGK